MDDSRNHDGAGAALIALVVVILLVIAVASYYWLSRRALVERERAMIAEAEAVRAVEQARDAAVRAAQLEGGSNLETDPATAERAIRKVLNQQLLAWNAGDFDGFMQHYWQSEDLTFSSGGNVTRGWQATLDSYQERYPSRSEMGITEFENLEVTPLGPEAALVLGDWRLTRESGALGGKFSLVFRRIDGRWVIVHDHTSRAEEP